MKKKSEIPPHTKWGIRVTTVIIIFIIIMIIKNCVGSVYYGISTDKDVQEQFYDLGYSHGILKAKGQKEMPAEPEIDNLLLRKEYRKGYRNGWDSIQLGKKDLSEPARTK